MMRRVWGLTVVSAAVLVFPAEAGALIQIDQGIAGARLNNTQKQVRAALGKPRRIINGINDFGPFTTFRYRGGITVNFQGRKRVSSVSTSGLGDRTARGVGVGSTEQAVKQKVPGVTCETIVGTRSCHTNEFVAGRRVTDFLIRKGRVRRVNVGFVID
jgi:hypothetical protein